MKCKCMYCQKTWTQESSIGVDFSVIRYPGKYVKHGDGYAYHCINTSECVRRRQESRLETQQPPPAKEELSEYWDKVNEHQKYLQDIGLMDRPALGESIDAAGMSGRHVAPASRESFSKDIEKYTYPRPTIPTEVFKVGDHVRWRRALCGGTILRRDDYRCRFEIVFDNNGDHEWMTDEEIENGEWSLVNSQPCGQKTNQQTGRTS